MFICRHIHTRTAYRIFRAAWVSTQDRWAAGRPFGPLRVPHAGRSPGSLCLRGQGWPAGRAKALGIKPRSTCLSLFRANSYRDSSFLRGCSFFRGPRSLLQEVDIGAWRILALKQGTRSAAGRPSISSWPTGAPPLGAWLWSRTWRARCWADGPKTRARTWRSSLPLASPCLLPEIQTWRRR